jgi:hypothetical protein
MTSVSFSKSSTLNLKLKALPNGQRSNNDGFYRFASNSLHFTTRNHLKRIRNALGTLESLNLAKWLVDSNEVLNFRLGK